MLEILHNYFDSPTKFQMYLIQMYLDSICRCFNKIILSIFTNFLKYLEYDRIKEKNQLRKITLKIFVIMEEMFF